ncbi:MAG: kelch repeat-containing protein, partial [Verrucomicrobiota bacterium]
MKSSPNICRMQVVLLRIIHLLALALISIQLSQSLKAETGSHVFNPTGSLSQARFLHTATLLANGKVLVAGGQGHYATLKSAELYDPATGTWSLTGQMTDRRAGHVAVLLENGEVLVVGGESEKGMLASAEIYNPSTGRWRLTVPLDVPRIGHTLTCMPGGIVVCLGGLNPPAYEGGDNVLAEERLYDPFFGIWGGLNGPPIIRRSHHTATLLPNGRLLCAGNATFDYIDGFDHGYSTELLPGLGVWFDTGAMVTPRGEHAAVLLANGEVLVVGGDSESGTNKAEIYNFNSRTWRAAPDLRSPRENGHTATLLPSGEVLVA